MRDFAAKIITAQAGKTHIFFLGQAGYVFKSMKGTLLAVDAYLTNCVERYDGFKRLMPVILSPDEITFDYVLATHSHYDHFDVDAMPVFMSNAKTKMFASAQCRLEINRLGIDEKKVTYISCGDSYQAGDIHIECVFCDHGSAAADAVGLLISINEKKIYIAGDTCLRLDKASELKKRGPFDIMIAPINGAFGNLNEAEMVSLCALIRPEIVIPCHYWNFAEHHGDPGLFIDIMKEELPGQNYLLMMPGESHEL